MRSVLMILLILLCPEKTNLELRLNQVEEPSILSDFTIRILGNHFRSIRKMAVLFSENFVEISNIIRRANVPIVVNSEEIPRLSGLDTREPCQVVFLMECLVNISRYLNSTLWTSETLFLVAVKKSDITDEVLQELFQSFWSANALNVFILVSNPQNILVYTYTPFVHERCNSLEKYLFDATSRNFSLSNQLNNLNGCILNVSVVDLPPMSLFPNLQSRNGTLKLEGTEVNIIYEIAKKFNFTPRFAIPRDGQTWGWINPEPHGAVGEVYRKYSHYAMGLLATTLERYEFLDMTEPVSPIRECITWAVPVGAAKAQATWLELYFSEFTVSVWCCIIFVFILVSFTFWIIARMYSSPDYFKVMMIMFAIFIYVPVKSPKQISLRPLFLTWIWYSFIVMVSYQSLMGSKLTVPYRRRDINTILDLLESDLHFTGFNNTFRLIKYEAEGDLKKVAERLEPTTYGITEAVNYITTKRNIAYLRETTSIYYYAMTHPQIKGNIHVMKECPYEYYPVMVLQKNSPLTKNTDKVIAALRESGILSSWRRRYIYTIRLPDPSSIQLSLEHMLVPFVGLILGIALSVVVFVFEQFFSSNIKTIS